MHEPIAKNSRSQSSKFRDDWLAFRMRAGIRAPRIRVPRIREPRSMRLSRRAASYMRIAFCVLRIKKRLCLRIGAFFYSACTSTKSAFIAPPNATAITGKQAANTSSKTTTKHKTIIPRMFLPLPLQCACTACLHKPCKPNAFVTALVVAALVCQPKAPLQRLVGMQALHFATL